MKPTIQFCRFLLFITVSVVASQTSLAATPARVHHGSRWDWLKGTYWYVTTEYMPALSTDVSTGRQQPVLDQTVWYIEGSKDGYLWGKTFVQITGGSKMCLGMVGSVTPEGRVQIVFTLPAGPGSQLAVKTTGTGRMRRVRGQWKFEMQMTSGSTTLITHWAFMAQCKEGQPCNRRLPGAGSSLQQFTQPCSQ